MKQETDINQFVEAINSISSVRDYDEKILETAQLNNSLACWAIIISLFVALITIIATIYIFRRQEKIIEEQLQVSNQQNIISLFEKRFHILILVRQIKRSIKTLDDTKVEIKKRCKAPMEIPVLFLEFLFKYISGVSVQPNSTPENMILFFQGELVKVQNQLYSTQYLFYLDYENKEYLRVLSELFTELFFLISDYTEEIDDTLVFDKILIINNFYKKSRFVEYLEKQINIL